MMLKAVKRLWKPRYGNVRFRLMDINCMAYAGLIGLLLIFFHKGVDIWPAYIILHFVCIIAILEVARLAGRYPESKIIMLMRICYPLAILLYGWRELDVLLPAIYGCYWGTGFVARLDRLIFGVHPTIWFQQWYKPWLDEIMHFFYFAYYSLFLFIPFYFMLRKKIKEAYAVFSLTTFAYLSNYALFFLMPVLDPQATPLIQVLQYKENTGYLFVWINSVIQLTSGVAGAAFPSSHVAGALVWILAAWRYSHKVGLLLSPIALGIGISTVYLGIHHAVDPIAGYIWGVVCFIIAVKLIKKRGEDPLTNP
jgi:membrane-associated phospholipid phosphatase